MKGKLAGSVTLILVTHNFTIMMREEICDQLRVCFLMVGCIVGQQQPYYTQYILNNFVLNPHLRDRKSYLGP